MSQKILFWAKILFLAQNYASLHHRILAKPVFKFSSNKYKKLI